MWSVISADAIVKEQRINAAGYIEARVYKVLERVAADMLINDITQKIAPQSWDEVGGPGSIRPLSFDAMVVSQTDDVHRRLADRYSKLLRPIVPPEKKPIKRPTDGRSTPDEALRQATEFEFLDAPLSDVVDILREMHRVKIEIDEKALRARGLDAKSVSLTMNLSDVSLASALEYLLGCSDLCYIVGDDALLITTTEEAENKTTIRSYKIDDLARMGDYDELIVAITSTIAPAAWQDVGGNGSLRAVPQRGELRITQSQQVHRRVERLLGDLRLAMKR